jgi:selenocysteine lyase/cysteine desulfurase
MAANRRTFVKQAGIIAGGLTLSGMMQPVFGEDRQVRNLLDRQLFPAPDPDLNEDDFWNWIKESYSVINTPVNLNNGGVSPQPKVVQEVHERYLAMCNQGPSYFMWQVLDQGREPLRAKLAGLAGCSPDEIAIDRNTTEALNSIIFGLNLKAGDEIVLTKQDYPNMIGAWKQREKRDGIKLVWLNLELPSDDEEALVKQYTDAFTSKTKLVHITHMINWNGQILPAKKIARKAHERGIEVLVDGAHTFAHLEYQIPDLECDYFGTSLHKWLCAPFGNGMMYIKKDKIKDVWPLLGNGEPQSEDIRKFESSLGTRSFPSEMSIGTAIDFHYLIGSKRKENRLRYLKNYWAEKAAKIPGVKLLTSLKPDFSCALCTFAIDGITAADITTQLYSKYKLHTSPTNWENIHGVRVTPHVYTSTRELDILVKAIEEIAHSVKKG